MPNLISSASFIVEIDVFIQTNRQADRKTDRETDRQTNSWTWHNIYFSHTEQKYIYTLSGHLLHLLQVKLFFNVFNDRRV